MTVYADANFYTNLLVELPQSGKADALAGAFRELGSPPMPVPQLLFLEIINAFQRLRFDARHGLQKIQITPKLALIAEDRFLDGLAKRVTWAPDEPDSTLLRGMFANLVHRHTAERGFRTYDLVHVASAIVLGCDTFWTFDDRAKKLAALEGLKTN